MRARRGFSLLEMLVALAIGLFVVAALYNLFSQQVRAFVYQDLQMEMHQNGRLGMDVLTRTARLAGLGTNGATTGALGAGGAVASELPAVIAYNGTGPNGSDAITLVSMDPALMVNTNESSPPSCTGTQLTVNPRTLNQGARLAQLSAGELLLCYDYARIGDFRSFLFEITAVNASTGIISVQSNTGLTDFDAICAADENLPIVMTCSRGEVVTYYVDADDSDGVGAGSADHPVLMMDLDFESPDVDDVPVVDNVEDLQIEYCLKASAGSTDCADASAWVDTLTAAEVEDLYMIRFSLVMRSSRPDPIRVHTENRPALADNPASTVDDHWFRQVISSEVTVRNMRIQSLL
ncbi:MAG: PilW family protein [Myxococcota bacterium]